MEYVTILLKSPQGLLPVPRVKSTDLNKAYKILSSGCLKAVRIPNITERFLRARHFAMLCKNYFILFSVWSRIISIILILQMRKLSQGEIM